MDKNNWKHVNSGGAGAVYGLGLVGALVFFLQHASNLREVIFGILQSLVWPALLTYHAFALLKF